MPGTQVTYQDYAYYIVRPAAILTTSYVAGNIIGNDKEFTSQPVSLQNQLVLLIDFTIGSLTSVDIKIEVAGVSTDFYQLLAPSSFSGGVETPQPLTIHLTATTKFAYSLPTKYRYIKVSALGTGTVTSSSLAINSIIGVA